MKLVTRKLKSLKPCPWNPRETLQPGEHEYEAIKSSLNEFGLVQPLVYNVRSKQLVGGHQRRQVMLDQGITEAQVVEVDLDEAAERKLNIQLNGTGRWDSSKLAALLQEMQGSQIDLSTLGFSPDRLDALLNPPDKSAAAKATLAQRFMIPPFSVLNAREGWWQERKTAWIALGIQSEVGRGENLLKMSDTILEPDPKKRASKMKATPPRPNSDTKP